MSAEVDHFLEHYGVPGMKWGKRKAQSTLSTTDSDGKPKKRIYSDEQKNLQKELVTTALLVGASLAIKKGVTWAANNPDKINTIITRANNVRNGTKAVGPGYEVVKLAMSTTGVYR